MANHHTPNTSTLISQLTYDDAGIERFSQPQSSISGKGKEKDHETVINNSDPLRSNLIGNFEQMKLDTDDVFHHSQGIVANEINNVRTPHSRLPLPNEIISIIIHILDDHRRNGTDYDSLNDSLDEEHGRLLSDYIMVNKQFYALANPLQWQCINFDETRISKRFLACVSDVSHERLATLAHPIRELLLDGPHWTDAQLTRLIPHMPHLERLFIFDNCDISTSTSISFECNRWTQASFSAIGQHCHDLSHLEWGIEPTQSPEWLALLLRCPLEHLFITIDTPLNATTTSIIQQFNSLVSLGICGEKEDAGIKDLLLEPTLWPQLTKLILDSCNDLDDTTFIEFIKSHPHLRYVELKHAIQLSDASLDAMAIWLPDLFSMDLKECGKMSAEGIRRFLENSPPHLIWISFEGCHRLGAHHFPEATFSTDSITYFHQTAIEKIKAGAKGREITTL